jgi:coenzyme F420-reducing hydrogenase delta subunit
MEVPLTAAWKDSPSLECHPVHRHSLDDSLRVDPRAHSIHLMLEDFGLEPECFRVSAPEGSRFAHMVTEMAEQIRKLGPGPYRTQ